MIENKDQKQESLQRTWKMMIPSIEDEAKKEGMEICKLLNEIFVFFVNEQQRDQSKIDKIYQKVDETHCEFPNTHQKLRNLINVLDEVVYLKNYGEL